MSFVWRQKKFFDIYKTISSDQQRQSVLHENIEQIVTVRCYSIIACKEKNISFGF